MTAPQPTAILIVGMHRSGTSALTGVLGKLGIPLGDRLLEPAGDNPKGYWEHEDVVAVHERLLAELGSRWDDMRALPSNWLESAPARLAAAAIGEIISRDFSDKAIWSVKDPRLCRFLPLWLDVLAKQGTRPVVLFMARKPSEVAASIQTRNHWRPIVGTLLWLRYMAEAVAESSGVARAVILYDDLLADPIRTVAAALALVDVTAQEEISQQEREAVAGFIDTSDRHHKNSVHDQAATAFDSIAEKVYDSLVAVAHGSAHWNAVEQAIEAFDREWVNSGSCIDAVADMAAHFDLAARAARVENCRVTSELSAQIHWSEEAQAKQEALQAERAELSSKLNAQIRWSEEARAKQEALQAERAELSSKLSAQIRWSNEAQMRYEALHAESVMLSSKLRGEIFDAVQASDKLAEQLQNIAAELAHTRTIQLAAEAQLRELYSSKSWKLTKPLRATARLFKRAIGFTNNSTRKSE